jgi:hypothetical protein
MLSTQFPSLWHFSLKLLYRVIYLRLLFRDCFMSRTGDFLNILDHNANNSFMVAFPIAYEAWARTFP